MNILFSTFVDRYVPPGFKFIRSNEKPYLASSGFYKRHHFESSSHILCIDIHKDGNIEFFNFETRRLVGEAESTLFVGGSRPTSAKSKNGKIIEKYVRSDGTAYEVIVDLGNL